MKRDEFIERLEANAAADIDIVRSKNQDYADGEDPFQNFRMVADAGLCSVEEGIAVRMSDKLQRVFNLIQADEAAVEDETVADTLSDLRNYANILQVWLQDEKGVHKDVVAQLEDQDGDDYSGYDSVILNPSGEPMFKSETISRSMSGGD